MALPEEQYQQLLSDARAYLNTQYDILRLGLLLHLLQKHLCPLRLFRGIRSWHP